MTVLSDNVSCIWWWKSVIGREPIGVEVAAGKNEQKSASKEDLVFKTLDIFSLLLLNINFANNASAFEIYFIVLSFQIYVLVHIEWWLYVGNSHLFISDVFIFTPEITDGCIT